MSERGFALANVPESLLGQIVESTLDRLAGLKPADVPVSLRNVVQFDRRARAGATVRRQVAKTLDLDEALADASAQALLERPDVAAAARLHDPDAPLSSVVAAAARGDLDLHVAALWAAGLVGATFALGIAVAFVHLDSVIADLEAARESAQRQAEAAVEAQRRADGALAEERARTTRLADELRDERSSRRSREESAAAKSEEHARRAEAAEARAAEERTRAAAAQARANESAARAVELREEVRRARAEIKALTERFATSVAAGDVRKFAERANALARDLMRSTDETSTNLSTTSPADERPRRRPRPKVPGGLTSDDPAGLAGMLGANGVLVVVDGYNAAFAGWPEATAADKREHLGRGLVDLHQRFGCEVLCVFDGDGTDTRGLRRDGVRVVFSPADEEADVVVVRAVRDLPIDRPAIVVSSDGWVREHSERAGAVVVPSPTLISLLRSRSVH
jgi:YacP-like NYN domain